MCFRMLRGCDLNAFLAKKPTGEKGVEDPRAYIRLANGIHVLHTLTLWLSSLMLPLPAREHPT